MEHLTDPENKVYFLTMEGMFFECDVHSLEVEFTILVDFQGNDDWIAFRKINVKGKDYDSYTFPDGYSAHWVKLKIDKQSVVTAPLNYD